MDGVTAVVVEPNPTRRRLAEELGAAVTIDGTHADLQGAIRGSLPQGLQGAVECSGHPSARAGAVASLAPGGAAVVAGAPPVGTAVELDVFDLTLGSKRILGSCQGNSEPAEMIPYLAGLVGHGQLPLDRLVTTYPLEEIERAAADMSAGRVIKPVLVFSQADSRD